LKIRAELDRGHYPTGIKITDAELASLNLKPDNFHGDWNYNGLSNRHVTRSLNVLCDGTESLY